MAAKIQGSARPPAVWTARPAADATVGHGEGFLMEEEILSRETSVTPLDKGGEKERRFWYDVRAVSGSHAEVTVSIAGLSLALLLVLPVFNVSGSWQPKMGVSTLFFFTSLAFGILASFEYSVLSGDRRSEMNRLITFMGPSAAFGVAIPTLFLGFVYAVDMYLGAMDNSVVWLVMVVMRWFTLLALWSAGVLVARTAVEALQFLNGTWRETAWYKGKMVIVLMFVYALSGAFSIVRLCSHRRWSIAFGKAEWYFYFMIFLAFMSVFHYALFSYMGIEREKRSGEKVVKFMLWLSSPEGVEAFTIALILAFSAFVIWTFLVFV